MAVSTARMVDELPVLRVELPAGCYARAGVGLRACQLTVAVEAWASAARVFQQHEDPVWFTTLAYAFGVGATF